MLLGIRLNLMAGLTVPKPVPAFMVEALTSVEVTQKSEGLSGCQLTFQTGRAGPKSVLDHPLLGSPQLAPQNRMIVTAFLGVRPYVVFDGIIKHQQLKPGSKPGDGTIVVTADDIAVLLNSECKVMLHPAQHDGTIAENILGDYSAYGIVAEVTKPKFLDTPVAEERVPVQRGSDLAFLKQLAKLHGYDFHITPGPTPGKSTAYWGPRLESTKAQPALTVNMGAATNVDDINFSFDPEKAERVVGHVQDRSTNKQLSIQTFSSTRRPLVSKPPFPFELATMKTVAPIPRSGLNAVQALGEAQAQSDKSTDKRVTVNGTLDVLRYGGVLEARKLVGLRGVGFLYDGLYHVESVTHKIQRGQYKQGFELTREGIGSTTMWLTT